MTTHCSLTTKSDLLTSMAVQLNSQQSAELQEQLKTVSEQLEKVHQVLAQKNYIIDSLEIDLEHMVELMRLQTSAKDLAATDASIARTIEASLAPERSKPSNKNARKHSHKWINRSLPGVSISC